MFARSLLASVPLFLAFSSASYAQSVAPEDMMRHIRILASDEYEGRKPGTPGETKTLHYLAQQFAALGMQPAGGNGSWYQPVGLVERQAIGQSAAWRIDGRQVPIANHEIALLGKDMRVQLLDRPLFFVGHGLPTQIAGAEMKGAVALMLSSPPQVTNAPRLAERIDAVRRAGASAVILLVGEQQMPYYTASYRAGQTRLQIDEAPQVQGAILASAVRNLIPDLDFAVGEDFRARRLTPALSLEVTSNVRAYNSYNVIGRLPGKSRSGESVLFLGHWDHLGICRPPDAEDRICNGAVDNASGMAMMIEVARHLSKRRHARDLIFMGTTAEEMGLLGADYFAQNPTVPLNSIVAAVNIDTVAIHPAGGAISYAGAGYAPLDAAIAEAATQLGRALDPANPANEFAQRQDGWVLAKRDVPAIGLLGGSFSNKEALTAFLEGPYHAPSDDLNRPIALDGAVEDADLHILLGRRLADPRRYRRDTR